MCAARVRSTGVPRVTLICAHPDDEVIGAGARLAHLGDVRIVHVTDGAPRDMTDANVNGFTSRDAYARARGCERDQALALAHVPREHIHDLGLVDQEASFALVELVRHLALRIEADRPGIVLTHAYEGGHPDHDATAFAVHAAVQLVGEAGGPTPEVVEFAAYHWDGDAMRTGAFLTRPDAPEHVTPLGNDEQLLKRAMFACYETQQRVLAYFPTDVERFRLAPAYDFTAPPHDGRLFYEWFDWRVTGAEWRRLARQALVDLGGLTISC
jgi:LmbE family N-acetylglucosaminyl deacetylase